MMPQDFLSKYNKEVNKALKTIFGNRIKQSFLLQIRTDVMNSMGTEVFNYYENMFKLSSETLIKCNSDSFMDYEICRNIVGIHRSNTIFMNDADRAKLQDDQEYRNKLVNEVCDHIRLRRYSGQFFRQNQLVLGDEFLFFPIPYKVFAICVRGGEILTSKKCFLNDQYIMIFNKGLSALTLLENNMFDSVYPICRAIIEIYIKALIFNLYPEAYDRYVKLCRYDLDKSCHGDFPGDFYQLFDNRKYKRETSRLAYLHFGFVDVIDDFNKKVKGKRYTIYSLFNYLKKHCIEIGDSNAETIDVIKDLYDICHTFTHGTSGNGGIPLAHYFNLVMMLGLTIEHSYRMLCDNEKIKTEINNIDIVSLLTDDMNLMWEQSKKRTKENFELYYKTFNCYEPLK